MSVATPDPNSPYNTSAGGSRHSTEYAHADWTISSCLHCRWSIVPEGNGWVHTDTRSSECSR